MRSLTERLRLILAPQLAIASSLEQDTANAGVNTGHPDTGAGDAKTGDMAACNMAAGDVAADNVAAGDAQARMTTTLAAERARGMHGLSSRGRARAERLFRLARQSSVPEHPLVVAMLEARAAATTEAQVLRAQQRAWARLKAAKDAMARAGRAHPSDAELSHGANVLAQGVTEMQLEVLVQCSPSGRALAGALATLTKLIVHGVPASTAVAKVGVRLEAHASDEAIRSLETALVASARTNADPPLPREAAHASVLALA